MTASTPTFLHPGGSQYPFDVLCDRIVRDLEARDWKVPGIDVEFRTYGSGEQKFSFVSRVSGEDFAIDFGRPVGCAPGGRWNHASGVSKICIPGRSIAVFGDDSGPVFHLYVGDDWDRDRKKFMHGIKINSRLNGEPRWYLTYKGRSARPGVDRRLMARLRTRGQLLRADVVDDRDFARSFCRRGEGDPPVEFLIHDDDLGREYDPEMSDPVVLSVDGVYAQICAHLSSTACAQIAAVARVASPRGGPPAAPVVPFPGQLGPLYCRASSSDARRIARGKRGDPALHPADRYGMHVDGKVLFARRWDGEVPDRARDAFLWCGVGIPAIYAQGSEFLELDRWGGDGQMVLRVRPRDCAEIYVVDLARFTSRCDAFRAEGRIPSEDQHRQGVLAMAQTMIPLAAYRGEFAVPLVLVGRDLALDEVEILGELRDGGIASVSAIGRLDGGDRA